jgi:hypothetical protein
MKAVFSLISDITRRLWTLYYLSDHFDPTQATDSPQLSLLFTLSYFSRFNLNPALETERVVGHSLDRIDLMDEMDLRSVSPSG